MMLQKGINTCSDDLWVSDQYSNRTWQMVYHTLFFTDLYLYQHLDQPEETFICTKKIITISVNQNGKAAL